MRLLLTLLVLLVAVAGFALMRRSWRRQAAEAEDLPPLPAIPAGAEREGEPLPGLYVGTTAAGDWLRRVVAHGLSERSPARLLMLPPHGVVLDRTPGEFLIPASALRDVRLDSAAAGKVIGAGGLIVLTWEHGGRTLESGFRADRQNRHAEWAERIRALVTVPAVAEPAVGEPAVGEPAVAAEQAEPPTSTAPFLPSAIGEQRTIRVTEPAADPAPEPAAAAATDEFDPLSAPLADVERRLAARPPARAGRPTGGSVPLVPAVAPTTPAPRPSAPALLTGARPPAVLVLEDGRSFRGEAYGAVGETYGEAVFSTGMTGYQETLTDPSYHRQVVVMTAPQIGNTGVNDDDPESDRIWVAGFVVRDPARRASDHRSTRSLEQELAASGVVGISGVDTRALTRHLRERGAMRVGVSSSRSDAAAVLADVRESPTMTGLALAQDVTTSRPYVVPAVGERRFTVAALDLGIKRSTPQHLAELGVEVHVLPATASAADLLAAGTDGVFISNGPGDPAATDGPVDAVRGVLDAGRPLFGICFGNQLLGRALGLGTYKLGYGHRGVNQPVRDRRTGAVQITSHNHGFAVDAPLEGTAATPYGPVQVSHVALNDGVVEGLECLEAPAFSVQYHPEAAPGPHDATGLFARFVQLMGSLR